jgi:hypothetical protein
MSTLCAIAQRDLGLFVSMLPMPRLNFWFLNAGSRAY